MKYPPYDRYYDMQTMWFGVIPFNWKTTNFRNILIGISDGTHGTHQRTITGKPLLSAKNVFNDSIKISENESRISEEEYKLIIAKGYPKKGDLLVTCVGTLGRSIVYPYEEPLAFQRSVAFLRLEKKYDLKYFKYLIESKGYQDFLVNTANVSAQGGIYMGDLAASE
ncbi:MAG: hypothetical protein OXD32_00145, partial [Endozoicomonadaceae bacterium]|nr:hypothetical protein [Endozoicomonadaceae bacterium]